MGTKRIGTIFMVLGFLMVMAAAAWTGYNIWDMHRAEQSAAQILFQIAPELASTQPEPEVPEETLPMQTEPVAVPTESIPDYVLMPDMPMPEKVVDGTAYIGTLEIPALELILPVASSWNYDRLRQSPCRYTGSAYTDNLVIAAHNYDRHFGKLSRLYADSEILFTDMDGNEFQYRVVEMEVLQPTAIEEMNGWNSGLTLFTCTIGGQSRVTIRAERISE